LKSLFTSFFMAWGMFFAVPCPCRLWDSRLRGGMLLCFPLIGTLIGCLWAGASWALSTAGCPPLLAAAVLALAPYLLTGFIHLDGFMDCCDAILSRRDLEGRQRILKDSHVGSFAVICLAALFLVQFALFASADLTGRRAGLVLICTVSRLCSALAIFLLPPMPGSSYAGSFRECLRPWQGPAAGCALAALVVLSPVVLGRAGLCAAVTAAGAWLAILDGRRQLGGGMSGDISGLAVTLGEVCGAAALALL